MVNRVTPHPATDKFPMPKIQKLDVLKKGEWFLRASSGNAGEVEKCVSCQSEAPVD
jgi:hypothetical protein